MKPQQASAPVVLEVQPDGTYAWPGYQSAYQNPRPAPQARRAVGQPILSPAPTHATWGQVATYLATVAVILCLLLAAALTLNQPSSEAPSINYGTDQSWSAPTHNV